MMHLNCASSLLFELSSLPASRRDESVIKSAVHSWSWSCLFALCHRRKNIHLQKHSSSSASANPPHCCRHSWWTSVLWMKDPQKCLLNNSTFVVPSVIMSPPDSTFQNTRLVKTEQVRCSKNTDLVFWEMNLVGSYPKGLSMVRKHLKV
jgi:hypothetical protein